MAVNRGIDPRGERTLQPAIIPPGPGHIDGVYTYAFERDDQVAAFAATWASLPVDFFVKSTGSADFRPNLGKQLPIPPEKKRRELIARALLLNCLTTHYIDLWNSVSQTLVGFDAWSKLDPRLNNDNFSLLGKPWSRDSALRSHYSRRQALVELDVLVADGLGMSLQELLSIYRSQFPVLRAYEKDTWYDRNGRIVFTTSRGLTGVGLSRQRERGSSTPGWEEVKDMKSGTFDVVIDDDTMPGGPIKRTITYEAPFDRCDRETDYAQAWEVFSRRANS